MSIHTLFFDFGNVVADFDHHRATRRFAKHSHLTEADIFDAIYNTQLEDDFEAGRVGADEFVARAMSLIAYRGPSDQFVAEFVDIFTPNTDVVALIPRLAGKYRLVLASNTNVLHADHFRQQMADTLSHFHALGLSYEAGARKPHPSFYAHCQALADGPSAGSLFIDDLGANVEAARAFGWHGVQFKSVETLRHDLHWAGVDV